MPDKFLPLVPFILVLTHFGADWLYQSHSEAMLKAKDARVRFFHCIKYTLPFAPVLWWMGLGSMTLVMSLAVLFLSHFVIDTYIPVMLWAKYLRRDPKFANVVPPVTISAEQWAVMMKDGIPVRTAWKDNVIDMPITYENDGQVLEAMFATPVGAILCITMDQFFHICFLLPVAMAVMAR